MDEQAKPFSVVSIVFLLMIGVANDLMEIMFDLFAATIVGLSGQAIMEPINILVDGLVTTWFVVALRSFGGATILQLVDDVLELFGIPGRTICIVLGIWIANKPDSSIGKFAQLATSAESLDLGSAAGLEQEIASQQGAHVGAAAASSIETQASADGRPSESAGGRVSKGISRNGGGGEGSEDSETPENAEKKARDEAAAEALRPEEEENPAEVLARKLNEGPQENSLEKKLDDEQSPRPPKKPVGKVQDIRGLNDVPPSALDDEQSA